MGEGKFWKNLIGRAKEMAKVAVVAGGVVVGASEATAQTASPVDESTKIENSEKFQFDRMVKLARGDKILVEKELGNYDGDTSRVLELFEIYSKLLTDNERALKNIKNDSDDDDEVVVSRRVPRGIAKLTPDEALSDAREIMQNGEGPVFLNKIIATEVAPEAEPTPEEKRAFDQESAAEQKQINIEKARRDLPGNLYNSLFSDDYILILKGKYKDNKVELALKREEYETCIANLIDKIGEKIKAKGKIISLAEAGQIIIGTAGSLGVEINQDGVSAAVAALSSAGYTR